MSSTRLHTLLFVVEVLLLISLTLPPPLNRMTRFGFILLTLLLAFGFRHPSSPPAARQPLRRWSDRLFLPLGLVSAGFQLLWFVHPASIGFSVPLVVAFYTVFVSWSLMRLLACLKGETRLDGRLLMGGAVGYLLLGLSGGLLLTALEILVPGGFRDNITGQIVTMPPPSVVGSPWDADFGRLLYFGFVCLTTVGFGDITPMTPLARLASLAISIVGPLYIAVVLGLLISRLSAGSSPPSRTSGDASGNPHSRSARAADPSRDRGP